MTCLKNRYSSSNDFVPEARAVGRSENLGGVIKLLKVNSALTTQDSNVALQNCHMQKQNVKTKPSELSRLHAKSQDFNHIKAQMFWFLR